MDIPDEKGTKMLMLASVTSLLLYVILLCDVISAHEKCLHLISCNFRVNIFVSQYSTEMSVF